MKLLLSGSLSAILLLLGLQVAAQDAGGGGGSGGQAATKENLDLPFDAFGLTEDEEEAPEVIYFYGQQYEGDGFFFCLDRSSSTAGQQIEIEKREAIRTISQFSRKVQFSVVFYDQTILKWPSTGRPAEADTGMKSAAIAWLATIQSGRGTCVREGLLESIKYANQSTARRNVIIYLGDGGTTCPGHDAAQYGQQTLSQVTSANYKRHQINAICVGSDVDTNFCKAIASMNNGTYKQVTQ